MRMNGRNAANEQLFLLIPPELRQNVQELCMSSALTLAPKPMKMTIGHACNTPYSDRFQILIPYGGSELQWEISYDLEDEEFVPDFEFLNDSFLMDPDIDVLDKNVPSLKHWSIETPSSLLSTISELLLLYKKHNMGRFFEENKFQRSLGEYKKLLENSHYEENDIEVYIDKDDNVNVLILLKINLEGLLIYVQEFINEENNGVDYKNPGDDAALVQVTFHATKVSSCLKISPRIEQCFEKNANIHIPSYSAEQGLTSYVTNVETMINESLNNIKLKQQARHEFVNTAISLLVQNVIIYDCFKFNYVHLQFEIDNFYCFVLLSLPNKFPMDPPQITFKATSHKFDNKPRSKILESFPYSPRWSAEELLTRLINMLQVELPKFKTACEDNVEYK